MIIGTIGMPGSGKSSKIIELLVAATVLHARLRIVDSEGEFVRYGAVYRSVSDYLKARTRMNGLVRVAVFHNPDLDDEGKRQLAADVAQLVCDEGGVLVLDELPVLVPPKKDPPVTVVRIFNRGRKEPQAGVWWGAQYAADVHDRFRRATRMYYVMHQADENDVEWVRRNTGRWGRIMRDLVPDLAPLDYVAVPRFGQMGPEPVVQRVGDPSVRIPASLYMARVASPVASPETPPDSAPST